MMINESGPVVVGVDGSPASLSAVDLAAEEALARVAPLVVLHARGPADHGREPLEVAVARARAEHPGLSVTGELVVGAPADVLVAAARRACLLVIGHAARCSRWSSAGPARGSLAAEVLRRARCAVLVHRPLDTSRPVSLPRPVLLAVASEVDAETAVEFAFVEADMRGAPLTAIHVWSRPEDGGAAGVLLGRHGFAQARDLADRMLVAALERWAEKYPGVHVHRTVRHCLDVPVALLAAARSAQLMVVGSTHRSTGAAPVTDVLVHRAGCPVAVVPLPPAR